MAVRIAASAVRTCLGDGPATFAALLAGRDGVAPLRHFDAKRLNVTHGYQIPDDGPPEPLRASRLLTDCVTEALRQAEIDPRTGRVLALVGTGLRELRAVESGAPVDTERLHFGSALAATGLTGALTLSNACSAGGHALALAQDLIELGEADAVVVGGTDTMTMSMLAMIGRVTEQPADRLRPFDADRRGVLLGEGAAALVVTAPDAARPGLGTVLATGLSCDAGHETAPDLDGILRAMRDALDRAGITPADVDLVAAHGTGTALNDPTELAALRALFAGTAPGPLVTAVKGAVGHTSGGSGLLSAAMVLECLRTGSVPPISGLRDPIPDAEGVRLVRAVTHAPLRTALVDSFGFGGLNAVTVLRAAA